MEHAATRQEQDEARRELEREGCPPCDESAPSNCAILSYWESVAGPVVDAVGIESNKGPVTLQGASFAIHIWTPEEIFALGILNSTAGKTISTYVDNAMP